ncbi:MAG: polysaccharide pyruvyl transferase family protein [Magnetococcales bacterium]|nr:polysaccharide pyruvyl transferase family protein [Magnetococcales bacterium]
MTKIFQNRVHSQPSRQEAEKKSSTPYVDNKPHHVTGIASDSDNTPLSNCKKIRAIHICLPLDDNLGDELAHAIISPLFQQYNIDLEIKKIDVMKLMIEAKYMDDEIDSINRSYDVVLIGAGGFMGYKLIDSIFYDANNWYKINIPVCFVGVGIIANAGGLNFYSTLDDTSSLGKALSIAKLVGVRDLNSWLLASRIIGQDSNRIMLTGCPTMQFVRVPTQNKKYSIAINIPFSHGVCQQFADMLRIIVVSLKENRNRVLWVCHSDIEEREAKSLIKQCDLAFDIVRPRTSVEAGIAYSSCRLALVVKAHAAIFCLANKVPFGFISYDIKCLQLMSMIVDDPYKYIIPIELTVEPDILQRVKNLLGHIENTQMNFSLAEQLLSKYFDTEINRYMKNFVDLLSSKKSNNKL